MILERTVIRWLYGRPLETLLATWGISLMLIQGVRTLFGAQNVQVINPAFMSGGIEAFTDIVLPWNRIVIIVFAFAVLAGMWLLLAKTRLGLFVRGVTQNRSMAALRRRRTTARRHVGVRAGLGHRGLAGCALSQIGNVGPDLGQAYIVDSFMVVVFGGVGQLAGTVYASLILGCRQQAAREPRPAPCSRRSRSSSSSSSSSSCGRRACSRCAGRAVEATERLRGRFGAAAHVRAARMGGARRGRALRLRALARS